MRLTIELRMRVSGPITLVPVTLMGEVPEDTPLVVTVIAVLPKPSDIVAGLKLTVALGGRPVAENETGYWNVLIGLEKIVYVALVPAGTVRELGDGVSEKSGAGSTIPPWTR